MLIFTITLFVTIFISPPKTLAKVVINEILPHPSSGSDWVELYNTEQGEEIDIAGWQIEDSKSTVKTFSDDTKISSSSSFLQVFVSNRLNNGGDLLRLKDESGGVIDEKSYEQDPGIDISIGRYPDGADNWEIILSSTPNGANTSFAPTFTPTPLPTSTPAPTKKPTSTPRPSATSKPQSRSVAVGKTSYVDKAPTSVLFPKSTDNSEDSSNSGIEEEKILGIDILGIEASTEGESSPSSEKKKSAGLLISLIGGGFVCIAGAVILSYKKIRSRCD